jgi:hypothetical protein
MEELTTDTITFGKYKNQSLDKLLRDRTYCNWILQEEWFEKNYEYLYNKILNYNPRNYFLKDRILTDNFVENYIYFNLKQPEEIELVLSNNEITCYKFYISLINELKEKIKDRIENCKENCFDIKAPTKWLQKFELETNLKRDEFKDFINSYDLPNIPYIIEDIKKEGGIEYNGAKCFIIAKENSKKQEDFWENILKEKYGENIGVQFKYQKCIFDFINISSNTLYECKISIKDYNESQHKKYILTLNKYNIIYLIGNDTIIDLQKKIIYTLNSAYYTIYQCNIALLQNPTKLDELIIDFLVVQIENINLQI